MHAVGTEVLIEGDGALARTLRDAHVQTECTTTVIVAEAEGPAIAFEDLTDEDFDASWERPMRRAITAFQTAHRDGRERIIAIVPTIGMSGAPRLSHVAATAEAIRVLVKSAARQWGADGITVNCIAVGPSLFDIDAAAVGAVSLAPPALVTTGGVVHDLVPLIRMVGSRDAHHLTGTTMTADGGTWMSP